MKKMRSIFAFVMAVALLMSLGVAAFADDAGESGEIEHRNHPWVKIIKDPTCEEDGIARYYDDNPVLNAQAIFHEVVLPALGHDWVLSDDIKTTGSCVDGAIEDGVYVCQRPGCNKTMTAEGLIYVSPDYYNHDWTGLAIEKQPTCAETGLAINICRKCYQKQEVVLPVLEPDYQAIKTVRIDCYTAEVTYQCSFCKGRVHPDYTEVVGQINHRFVKEDAYVADVYGAYDCELDTIIVYECIECGETYDNIANDWFCYDVIPGHDHAWGEWVKRVDLNQNGGDNTWTYWLRACELCGKVQELVEEGSEKPDDGIIPNAFEIGLDNVTVDGTTSGTGEVYWVDGNEWLAPMYARVTWVYTLSNGDSFAYCAMKNVMFNADESMTFNMVGPQKPFGATLDSVQVALVYDANADASGAYTPLAVASK